MQLCNVYNKQKKTTEKIGHESDRFFLLFSQHDHQNRCFFDSLHTKMTGISSKIKEIFN